MKILNLDGHLEKAQAFEDRANRWESVREVPSVIEDIFDAMVHYIAYGINKKYKKDIDSHLMQRRFLKGKGETGVLSAYNTIENIRIGSVYGGQWNGDRVKKCMLYLEEIKYWAGIRGR